MPYSFLIPPSHRLLAPLTGVLLALGSVVALLRADPPGKPPTGPLSPREELATFRIPPGFTVELVASEPDVVDPVAIAFDEEGRLYVAEMRGYPNAGVATGTIHSGKIKRLEDKDGDGIYETCTTFADHLRFPTSVMPWKHGVLAAVAPDLMYLEDANVDGRAESQRVLYTGFALDNIQQLVNGLQWGMDNWVHGMAGGKGGDIRSAEKPAMPLVTLRGRGIRFHPEEPGSLEPTSGGGQFGLAPDDWQQWFTATNSQHLRHIVLPDHYLRRNPFLAVPAVTLDIPDHGAACKVERISPFEGWRVERTTRRASSADARRFPSTELVPGGFITSACSPVVYTADRFPPEYRGCTFVCDPANNLIHRDVLQSQGATWTARLADHGREFFASTDNWCRPVNLTIGPDGALYMVDFYREVIETPLSLPDDIKEKLNLESRGRGRIWRIQAGSAPRRPRPSLRSAPTATLVAHLDDPNPWWRLTAQRLLIERQDIRALAPLESLFKSARTPQGRAHALWTMRGLGALTDDLIEQALADAHPGVRAQALRLAERNLAISPRLQAAAAALAEDSDPKVRLQLALTAGEADAPELAKALATLAHRDAADTWTQTAVLSSASRSAPALLEALVKDRVFMQSESVSRPLVTRLAALVGARGSDAELSRALALLDGSGAGWQTAVLSGLGQGLQNSKRPLAGLWRQPPPALREAVEKVRPFFDRAATTACSEQRPLAERLAAIQLLGFGPFSVAGPALQELLSSRQPQEVQLVAVRALALQDDPQVAGLLVTPMNGSSPSVRRELLEAVFARSSRLSALLDAIAAKQITPGQLEPFRVEQLRKHPDASIRQRATTLLTGAVSDRQKIVQDYRAALELKPEASRGKALFTKHCTTCHRLQNEGTEVGPDLAAALRNKTPEGLVIDILDPSREVDPRYINYVVTTTNGRVLTGMIAAETASSVTLRRAQRAEDTVLRTQIDEIQATAKSVMPEGLEQQLSKQELADLIAYLLSAAAPK